VTVGAGALCHDSSFDPAEKEGVRTIAQSEVADYNAPSSNIFAKVS
jgi:hypothetical protein